MRCLFVFCVLILSCSLASNPYPSSKLVAEETEPKEAVTLKVLFGYGTGDMKTPEEVPVTEVSDLDVYPIRTRIIIEGQPIKVNHKGEEITAMWWAKSIEDIRRDLDIGEKLFESVKIKFVVTEVSYREFQPNVLRYWIDANNQTGLLSVVYMLPSAFDFDGYSSAPWEAVNRGIVIHYRADKWTLAHEVGHYFGLMHPFVDDFVEDTPIQKRTYCSGPVNSTSNCHNLMNYCDHDPKHITPGQIDRFRRFLRATRVDHLTRARSSIFLRNHDFPNPGGTNIIYNLHFSDTILPKVAD